MERQCHELEDNPLGKEARRLRKRVQTSVSTHLRDHDGGAITINRAEAHVVRTDLAANSFLELLEPKLGDKGHHLSHNFTYRLHGSVLQQRRLAK